nr:hypothetical protein [Tanacetum cinerariifolium]
VTISDVLVSSITQVVNLFLEWKCPNILGEYIACVPLTPLVKPGGDNRPIAVITVWRRLVSKVSAAMIGHSLDGYLNDLQFGVGVSWGWEAILHAVNRLIEDRGDNVGLSMLFVDFKNAFNLVNREVMLQEVRLRCPTISRLNVVTPTQLDYIMGNTLYGHIKVCNKVILLDLFFLPYVDFDFRSGLVLRRVAKSIELMDVVSKLNDPQCELLLLRAWAGISKLYFYVCTCSLRVFDWAQHSFDAALRSSLERIVTASGPGFGDWQWRLAILPFSYEGLVSTLQIDILSNPRKIAAPELMKKLANIYFTNVTQTAESTFSLSTRQMALWKSHMEDHTSDWLRVVLISELGQTMNGKTYRVFTGDIYGGNVVSCAGIVGIKHQHNVVRDTLIDICFRSGISAGKEVDIGLGRGRDKLLRPADILPYSWAVGLMLHNVNALSMRLNAANIGYRFLPFSFSSFGKLEKDTVTLLKRIRKFSVA